jgi:hypothetical protein
VQRRRGGDDLRDADAEREADGRAHDMRSREKPNTEPCSSITPMTP